MLLWRCSKIVTIHDDTGGISPTEMRSSSAPIAVNMAVLLMIMSIIFSFDANSGFYEVELNEIFWNLLASLKALALKRWSVCSGAFSAKP